MKVPNRPLSLMMGIYRQVLPAVHEYLYQWKEKARLIPNEELRSQALMSIETKTFHCEGGGVYGLLAGKELPKVIEFIVAYQTISDYLDNLCDRSTSLNPTDFRALHASMLHALKPGAQTENYYRYRNDQNDGGYLEKLVKTCQSILMTLPSYEKIAPALLELAQYYCDLQVHKHVSYEERVPRLEAWFQEYEDNLPKMNWYEFSACTGSTLGIFCLVAYATAETLSNEDVAKVKDGYFPWVQGLHILLDYFIDQEEDRLGGDLNFCFYYRDRAHLVERLEHFTEKADESIRNLPDASFHYMINKGLLGIYLADEKVRSQKEVRKIAKRILRLGGGATLFFYFNGWLYRRKKSS
ncbi:tetraprenyl-beta-curcumene synthase family protein [Anaerobacillus sp. MEB173]|uniref:tetraprenyl-beta-curcumene synthase family protein n=1 Tax=Anaerobacillus sp. MEB173 TaxID=3383345 RepID=UPI003F91B76F